MRDPPGFSLNCGLIIDGYLVTRMVKSISTSWLLATLKEGSSRIFLKLRIINCRISGAPSYLGCPRQKRDPPGFSKNCGLIIAGWIHGARILISFPEKVRKNTRFLLKMFVTHEGQIRIRISLCGRIRISIFPRSNPYPYFQSLDT